MPTPSDEQQQPRPDSAPAADDPAPEAPGTEPEQDRADETEGPEEAEGPDDPNEPEEPGEPDEPQEAEGSDDLDEPEEPGEPEEPQEPQEHDSGDAQRDAEEEQQDEQGEAGAEAEPEAEPQDTEPEPDDDTAVAPSLQAAPHDPVTSGNLPPAPDAAWTADPASRFPRLREAASRIGRGAGDVRLAVGALATLGADFVAERRGARIAVAAGAAVVVVALVLTVTLGSGPSASTAADLGSGGKRHPGAAAPSVPRPSLAVPASFTVPGRLALAWPATGQAAIGVPGVGLLGSSGPVDSPRPIASVTKTMTAYLILKDHPLALGESGPTLTVTAAEAAALPGQVALHQSLVPVRTGERFTERQALQALMLASADNMAEILASWDAGSESRFVARMNATAARLGMARTHFSQPSGYLGTSVSTATDLVRLGEVAIRDPFFADLVDETSAVIPGGAIRNYNALLGQNGVDGIKTGSTNWAGGCLLFSAHTRVAGHEVTLVGAVLGQPGNISTMLPSVFAATARLLRSADHALEQVTVVGRGRTVAKLPALPGADGTPWLLGAPRALTLVGWPGLRLTLRLSGPAARPVLQALTPDGRTAAAVPLVSR